MKITIRKIAFHIKYLFIYIFYLPHFKQYHKTGKKEIINSDIHVWLKAYKLPFNERFGFIFLMRNFKPFRNLFYQRAGRGRLLVFLCPPDDKLIIDHTTKIGSGLLLYHPYSTIINAKEIGDNCIIRHLTTLGNIDNDNTKRPIIKNNVDIGCNVIILGAVEIGNNCKIGAGSVVTKNVPDNCVVVGNPAYIIKNDGVKVRQEL